MATDLTKLIQEVRSLTPDEKDRLRAVLSEESSVPVRALPPPSPLTDEEYQTRLVAAGLLKRVKPRHRDREAFDQFQPVEISGKPLSETIIEERR
jgi:hypothetical protein